MNIILAADKKWAIGKDNNLLMHLPGDLKYFKKITTGKTVVMGRKTLESLPGGKPLPGRRNIVITRNESIAVDGAEVVHSVEEMMDLLKNVPENEIFIIGGEQIYKQMVPYTDTFYITKIYKDLPADRYFVDLDAMPELRITWEGPIEEHGDTKYQFFIYKRREA